MTRATSLADKQHRANEVLRQLGSVIVAFSGGTDSSLVLKLAHDTLGDRATAVTAVSATFPEAELEETRRIAAEIGAQHRIVDTDQLRIQEFVRNDAARCYHCKTDLYSLLDGLRRANPDVHLVDGTNLDDLGDDRPGLRAAREWGVRSPLVDAGLSKAEVRELARTLGLSNWDKPAAACLSSRIPRGVEITRAALSRVEQAEVVLVRAGFRHCRVRDHGDMARIEVAPEECAALVEAARRTLVVSDLKRLGYKFVTLDLEGYRRGGVSLQ